MGGGEKSSSSQIVLNWAKGVDENAVGVAFCLVSFQKRYYVLVFYFLLFKFFLVAEFVNLEVFVNVGDKNEILID